ncbi:MAG: hypothetical protein N3C57_08045 [Aquificaceae bacterium]|nr:hypothetical protein [Aquificaceae bacterium]
MVYLFLINLTEVLTIISALTGFIGLAVSLLNIRIEDTNGRIYGFRSPSQRR